MPSISSVLVRNMMRTKSKVEPSILHKSHSSTEYVSRTSEFQYLVGEQAKAKVREFR